MKIGIRLRDFAEHFAVEVEAAPRFYLIAFSVVLFGLTALRALAKPFWYDELFTYYMCRLPDLATTWSALKGGADLNPPLLYIATRATQSMFGAGPVATRLPAMLGFLTMLVCLFVFVARRCGPACGFGAMLFAALSGAYPFAYEARSYGMVLGFCGLALVAWQSAADGRARRLAVPGLFLSLACALLTHCYAVLILVPFALGELVRLLQRRRGDWPVWMAVAAASGSVLSYFPLLANNLRIVQDNVTFRPTLRVLAESYGMLAAPLMAPLTAALILVALSRRQDSPASAPGPGNAGGFRAHEIAAALGLAAAPVFAFLIASFVSKVFMTRYGVSAAIGFTILFAWFVDRYPSNRRLAGGIVAPLFAAWFLSAFALWFVDTARSHVAAASRSPSGQHAYEAVPELVQTDLPFVASNGLFFLEADHYATPAFVDRLFYLTDPKTAVRYTGTDVFDTGLVTLQKWFPIRAHIETYDAFVAAHQRFLVFGEFDHPLGWLAKKLLDDGAELRFLGQYHGSYGDNLLLEVNLRPQEAGLAQRR